MARFYKIKIDSVYLTDDGTNTGRPCKIEGEGIGSLLIPNSGSTSVAASGTPFREKPLAPTGGGRPFAFTAAFMTKAVYDSLKTILDTIAASNASINITGSGTPGDFNVDAIVNDSPAYLSVQGFSGDMLRGVRFAFITATIH